MVAKRTVFIAFAMEDEGQRNLFTGQRVNAGTPFEFVDLSVKEKYETQWKERVRTRIRRSDGVIALISSSTARHRAAVGDQLRVAGGQTAVGDLAR